MENQKLKDWVKSKLSEGYSSQEIKEALLKEGYIDNEINEATGTIENTMSIPENTTPVTENITTINNNTSTNNPPKTPKKSKVILLVICLIVVILIILSIIFFYNKDNKSPANNYPLVDLDQNNNTPPDDSNLDSNASCNSQTIDCFINNLEKCSPMEYQYTLKIQAPLMPILLLESGQLHNIVGSTNGICKIDIKQNIYNFSRNAEMTDQKYREYLTDMGMYDEAEYTYPSDEQINEFITQMSATADYIIGLQSACDFNSDQMAMLISNFRLAKDGHYEGSTDSTNFLYSNCDGNLFNTGS